MTIRILLFSFLIASSFFPQNKIARLDSLFNTAYKMDLFSGTAIIADKEKTIYIKSFGYADWDNQIPNETDTKFNIGSIGKLFTQILIMQLVQEGKLDLTDPLGKHIKLYNNSFDDKITVIQLLTFSAGLGDYFMIEEFRKNSEEYKTVKSLLLLIGQEPILYEPGTSNMYSNSSYVVLGGIIEKLTGKSYEENLKERILNRLGMNSSGFIYKNTEKYNCAKGFIVSYSGLKRSTYERMPSVPTPAGGMYSTAEDLLKLDRSLMNDNRLLDNKYKMILLNGFRDPGITWDELKAHPNFGLGAAGGSPGFNSVYDQNVGGEYTVIILSNIDGGAEKLIERVNGILNGVEIPPLLPLMAKMIYAVLAERGVEYFVNNYKDLFSKYRIEDDRQLNNIGYDFLRDELTDYAIAVFTANTKLFSEISNTYDSLGEAYLISGNKELALENYKKAFEINPENKNVERIINEINQKK